jgi:hypothetical protein
MLRKDRMLMRLAVAIHKRLHPHPATETYIQLPTEGWVECQNLVRTLQRASQRGWQLAAARLRRDLSLTVERMRDELRTLDRQLQPPISSDHKTSTDDIYADLIALHDEFEEVAFDRRGRTLAVTTETIELEGVYLGPFEIRLDWGDLLEGHPDNYRVIAVDANPAAANDSVTHPHVQDEAVCEGGGRQPVRKALEQGRLFDFFVIVANLLRTYNSGSPYVSLSDWHGVECADCGSNVCDDERWTCEKCETTVCDECYHNCSDCDGIYCNECVTRCEGCDKNHCRGCMKQGSRCDAELCQGCLDDNERCSDCHERETEEESEELARDRYDDGRANTHAPLQPDGVGQVAISA